MPTQWHLPPPLTSTVKSSLFTHAHSSPLSLAARLHGCWQTLVVTVTMAGLFPDRPHVSFSEFLGTFLLGQFFSSLSDYFRKSQVGTSALSYLFSPCPSVFTTASQLQAPACRILLYLVSTDTALLALHVFLRLYMVRLYVVLFIYFYTNTLALFLCSLYKGSFENRVKSQQ